jgi:hypothetical protein
MRNDWITLLYLWTKTKNKQSSCQAYPVTSSAQRHIHRPLCSHARCPPSHAGGAAPPSQHLRRRPSWWETWRPGALRRSPSSRPATGCGRPSWCPPSLSCARRPPSAAQTGIPRHPGVLECIQWISPKGKIEPLARPIPVTAHCSSYASRRLVVLCKLVVKRACCQIC